MCDVCAAHCDKAAVRVDVDAQGSSLREVVTHFTLHAKAICRLFVSKGMLVGLSWHAEEAVVILGFPMSLKEKKAKEFTVKAPRGASHPGQKGCAGGIAVCGLMFGH